MYMLHACVAHLCGLTSPGTKGYCSLTAICHLLKPGRCVGLKAQFSADKIHLVYDEARLSTALLLR